MMFWITESLYNILGLDNLIVIDSPVCRRLGEPLKAEGFLMDALKIYKQEGWDLLAANCRLEVATCQEQAGCQDR